MTLQVFALNTSRSFGEAVASALGLPLAEHEERTFEDFEHKARPLECVRGRNVFVISSLHADATESPNDKLCKLLFFIGALKENGAARVTAVTPYIAYARKDRQTKSRDPVTTRYVAALFEAVGTDAVMTLDVHNIVAFQNAFRCETVHLDTRRLFIEHLRARIRDHPVCVLSPDPGGVKRAQLFQELLEASLGRPVERGFLDKRRSAGVVSGDLLVGDVAGTRVLVVDDLISTGGTMLRAAEACLESGAKEVFALAAHGLFVGDAATVVADSRLAKVIVTDSVPTFRLPLDVAARHVEVVSAAPLFAAAIKRCAEGGSVTALLESPA